VAASLAEAGPAQGAGVHGEWQRARLTTSTQRVRAWQHSAGRSTRLPGRGRTRGGAHASRGVPWSPTRARRAPDIKPAHRADVAASRKDLCVLRWGPRGQYRQLEGAPQRRDAGRRSFGRQRGGLLEGALWGRGGGRDE
jgi:hypothetical protein